MPCGDFGAVCKRRRGVMGEDALGCGRLLNIARNRDLVPCLSVAYGFEGEVLPEVGLRILARVLPWLSTTGGSGSGLSRRFTGE